MLRNGQIYKNSANIRFEVLVVESKHVFGKLIFSIDNIKTILLPIDHIERSQDWVLIQQ